MNKQIKKITFALILGITAISANNSFASSNLPLNGKNDELTSFVKTKAARFSKVNLENLKKYDEVVDLYNNSSVSFYNLNETQKIEFISASSALIKSLSELNNGEAKSLANKVKLNQSVFEFIWTSKNINSDLVLN